MNRSSLVIIICGILIFVTFFIVQAGRGKPPKSSMPFFKNQQDTQQTDATKDENYESGVSLDITNPTPGSTVTSETITVHGKTTPYAEIFINDAEVKANAAGNFSTQLILDEGENEIIVVVNDEEGNSAEKQILVIYEPQE